MTDSIYTATLVGDVSASGLAVDSLNAATIEGDATASGVEADAYIDGVTIVRTPNVPPATRSTLGTVIVGEDLLVTEEGVLSVDKATSAEGDNTRPITAAAVYTEIGNINALLATI